MAVDSRDPLMPDDVRRAFAAGAGREPDARERSVLHGQETPAVSAAAPADSGLMPQARAGVMRLPGWLFAEPAERERLAAALVFEARMAGFSRIDDVVPTASGTGVYAVQGRAGDPDHRSVRVEPSMLVREAFDAPPNRQAEDEEAARRRAAERAAMREPDGPATPMQRLRGLLS